MQKFLKLSVLFVFVMTAAMSFGRISHVLPAANKTVTMSSENAARDLFLKNCARCHGANGKSETELGRLFGAPDLTEKDVKKMSRKKISRIILNGEGGMPAFKKKLSPKEVAVLVNYVRSLK